MSKEGKAIRKLKIECIENILRLNGLNHYAGLYANSSDSDEYFRKLIRDLMVGMWWHQELAVHHSRYTADYLKYLHASDVFEDAAYEIGFNKSALLNPEHIDRIKYTLDLLIVVNGYWNELLKGYLKCELMD